MHDLSGQSLVHSRRIWESAMPGIQSLLLPIDETSLREVQAVDRTLVTTPSEIPLCKI
jgi:hypothetical protein